MLETGDGQAEDVADLLRENGLADVAVTRDLAGLDRYVSGRWSG